MQNISNFEPEYLENLLRFRGIVSSSNDAITFIDKEYVYRIANENFLATICKNKNNIVGQHVEEIIGQDEFENEIKSKLDLALSGEEINWQHWTNAPGKQTLFEETYKPYRNSLGEIDGVSITARDITNSKIQEEKLSYQATHDALTGLVNRREFERRVVELTLRCRGDEEHALFYLDLD